MDILELVLKVSEEGLSVEEGRSGERLALPLAFWRALSESLRASGYYQHASVLDRAIQAAQARQRLLSEQLQCMEPAYDREAQARCQALLSEELRPEGR